LTIKEDDQFKVATSNNSMELLMNRLKDLGIEDPTEE